MTGTGWRIAWSYGGRHGEVTSATVRYQESGSVYGDRGGPTVRRVSVEAVIDEMRAPETAALLTPPSSGRAVIYRGDVEIVRGPISDLEYGPLGEPVAFRVAEDAREDTARIPLVGDQTRLLVDLDLTEQIARRLDDATPPWHAIDLTGWTARAPVTEGRAYPMVLGAPGTSDAPGSPAWMIDETSLSAQWLIAGHPVEASTVTLWGPDSSGDRTSDAGVPVLHQRDGRGQLVAYVREQDLTNVVRDPDADYYVSWTGGDALPGGAGDVLAMLYGLSSLRCDLAAFQAVAGRLNTYQLAGYVDETGAPSALAAGQVLPLLPLSITRGPRGLQPELWPYVDGAAVGPTLEVGTHGVSRAGRVRYLDAAPLRSVVVEYGLRPDERVYTRRLAVDPTSSIRARLSAAARDAEPVVVRAGLVWDDTTAGLIAADLMRQRGWPRRVVPLQVHDLDRWGAEGTHPLRVGQPVTLTDAAVEIDGERGLVGAIERDGVSLRVDVHLLDDPLQR